MKLLSVLAIVAFPYFCFADFVNISIDDKPSFDCSKKTKSVEDIICDSKELSNLDKELSISYKAVISNKRYKESAKTWQMAWLYYTRDTCHDEVSLKNAYKSQINKLHSFYENMFKESVSGEYQRYLGNKIDKNEAVINILELDHHKVQVIGSSMWMIGDINSGVNTGEMYGVSNLTENKVDYIDSLDYGCKLTLIFHNNSLTVSGDESNCGGNNVTFNGEYKKVIHK